jgi:hypothetical protein
MWNQNVRNFRMRLLYYFTSLLYTSYYFIVSFMLRCELNYLYFCAFTILLWMLQSDYHQMKGWCNWIFVCLWRNSLTRARPPHCRGFEITHRHATLGRNPLDEESARCRGLYLFFAFINQQSEYKVFHKLMCWLGLVCRLTSMMRSPPASRSRRPCYRSAGHSLFNLRMT